MKDFTNLIDDAVEEDEDLTTEEMEEMIIEHETMQLDYDNGALPSLALLN